MPSHKHKKKKKSHKKSKRHATSSSDDESFWKVPLSDSGNDESENGEILTSLVRRSYINHLRQVLIENFKNGMETTELCNNSLYELANKWTAVLESKAIRASMLSEMYRRSMVSSIKSIKAKTSLRRIYVDEQILSKLKLSLSKETQTEDFDIGKRCDAEIQTEFPPVNQVCAVETQTDLALSSLLQLPLPKVLPVSPSTRPYDPAINFSDSCPSSPDVSSTQPQPSLSEMCSITSTSDLVSAAQMPYDTLSSEVIVKNNIKNLIKATSTTCDTNIKMNDYKSLITDNQKLHSVEDISNNGNVKGDLDTRLTAMGLLKETETDIEKSRKSNWYAEEIAQSCNLTRILLRMTTKQQKRVLKKIKKLFGDENETLTELSEENIGICRKRIASVVVFELTPLYQAKKIASRYLFKLVAKKITKSLMEQSYAPDSRSIRQKVKELFKNGHVIMSESDCTLRSY